MFSSLFWKDFAERLVATLAQVASGLLTADVATGVSGEAWIITLAVAGLGVLAKCLAARGISDTVSPASLMPAAPDRPAKDADKVAEEKKEDAVGPLTTANPDDDAVGVLNA